MDKGGKASTEKTLAIAEKMAHYGIVPEFSFVLGSPPDPETDVEQTLEFIRRLKTINSDSEIVRYLYTPVPLAGDLYEQAREKGFDWPETLQEWTSPEWQAFSLRRSDRLPWLNGSVGSRIRNFERVLNAYYPTSTDPKLRGSWSLILRIASAWRYRLRIYKYPLELRALQRWMHYQRPETTGF